jgi:16S rRNA (cytosine967-C5)-methyltransferase
LARKAEPAGLPLRLAAARRLADVMADGRFVPLTAAETADSRDRALANRLVTTALRRRGHIDMIVGELLERGLPKKSGQFEAILRIALAQLIYLPDLGAHSAIFLAVEALKRDTKGQHLRGLLNAVLRHAQANAARYWSLDENLLLPERYRRPGTADALLAGAQLDLTLRDNDPELVAALGASPVMGDTVRIELRDRPVEALPGYAEGRWWAQDAAAAIPARLIDVPAGSTVIDLCAAPGGKTAQLIKAGFRTVAVDNDKDRLGRLKSNLDRLGYEAEIVVADAATWRPPAPADAVLLDAPCTATGTLRRHPEVVWRQSEAGLKTLADIQRAMLANAAESLRPGGVLVYSVCSLEAAEGEEQAAWIAANLAQLEPFPVDVFPDMAEVLTAEGHIRTWPGMTAPGLAGGTLDGFFVARFRRRAH